MEFDRFRLDQITLYERQLGQQAFDGDPYGLFVEHYQKYEVIWNGESGKVTRAS